MQVALNGLQTLVCHSFADPGQWVTNEPVDGSKGVPAGMGTAGEVVAAGELLVFVFVGLSGPGQD